MAILLLVVRFFVTGGLEAAGVVRGIVAAGSVKGEEISALLLMLEGQRMLGKRQESKYCIRLSSRLQGSMVVKTADSYAMCKVEEGTPSCL